jgi:hypothetical protein
LASSSTPDVWETIAADAVAESPVWGDALRAQPEREPVFSPVVPERFALGLESIYEGYLLHYGRPRIFDPGDVDTALLLGDYLYAHGLVRIASLGEVDAVAALAELISTCAHLRGEGQSSDGDAWIGAARRLGGDPDRPAVERALAAHAARIA